MGFGTSFPFVLMPCSWLHFRCAWLESCLREPTNTLYASGVSNVLALLHPLYGTDFNSLSTPLYTQYCSLQVESVKARCLYFKLLLTPKFRGYPYLRRLEVCILHFSSLTTPDYIIVGSLVLCRFALRACYKNQEFSSVYVLISVWLTGYLQ